MASSAYRGVSWHKNRRVWVAQLRVGNTVRYLGSYDTPMKAAFAHDDEAREVFGERARLNVWSTK